MKNLMLPIRFGIVTSAVLIAYFLILALLEKHTNIFFSFFNGVITGFGIYETLKIIRLREGSKFTYGSGFKAGITTGVVATIFFTIFFAFYSTELNSSFLEELAQVWAKDYANFKGIAFFTVAIMGIVTSVVLTLACMQLFNTSKNLKK